MKNIRKICAAGVIASLALAVTSCKKLDFGEEYNVNPAPNVSSFANTAQLLTNVMLNAGGGLTISAQEQGYYVQWLMQSQYPENANYTTTNVGWAGYYSGPLMDCQTIINYNTGATAADAKVTVNGSNANQIAIARILKAWFFSIVTDRWGDVPYSSALALNFNPTYDKQNAIYTELFKELKAGAAQFDGGAAVKGDILFNGDAAKWKRFANSLRMVLALRLSKANPTQGRAEFALAYNDAAGWVNSNDKNISYTYLNNTNFRSPWNANFETRDDWGVSDVFVNWLNGNNDKRLAIFAQPNAQGQYKGIPYGYNRDQLIGWTAAGNDYSRMGTKIIGYTLNANVRTLISYAPSPGYIFTASQMWLTVAEANALGWVGAASDVATSYRNGVQASWDQWGVTYTPAELTAYLAGANINVVGVTGNDLLKAIALQKWVSLYPNGLEGWSEWRRTNFPVLTPSAAAMNDSKKIPIRNAYPVNEPTLNGANYNAQVGSMTGGDTHDTPVWWDK
jgi:Starch-binding associating with outer membrane